MYVHTIADVYSNCEDEKRTTADSGVGQTSRKGGFLTFQRWERKATVPEEQKPHEQGRGVLQGTVDCFLTLV